MAEDCSSEVKRHSETLYAWYPGMAGPSKNLAGKTPGEMVRAGAKAQSSHHYFLRTRRGSRVRGASAQVFARVSLANHLSWSGAFGRIAYFLTTRRLEE